MSSMDYFSYSDVLDGSVVDEMPAFLRSTAGEHSDLPFLHLCTRFDALCASLTKLGGRLGTEDEADSLMNEQMAVVRAISAHRVRSSKQTARKLSIALAMIDECDEAIRALIQSAANDLN